jgi:hypothetical protein
LISKKFYGGLLQSPNYAGPCVSGSAKLILQQEFIVRLIKRKKGMCGILIFFYFLISATVNQSS